VILKFAESISVGTQILQLAEKAKTKKPGATALDKITTAMCVSNSILLTELPNLRRLVYA